MDGWLVNLEKRVEIGTKEALIEVKYFNNHHSIRIYVRKVLGEKFLLLRFKANGLRLLFNVQEI